MAPQQAKIMNMVAIVFAPLSLFVTIYFPAGLQWFFLMTGGLQYLQTWVFYQPWLRRWAKLPVLELKGAATPVAPKTSPFSAKSANWQAPRTITTTASPAKPESNIMSSLKGGMETFREKLDNHQAKTRKKSENTQAEMYEKRRRLEEEAKLSARREEAIRKRQSRP